MATYNPAGLKAVHYSTDGTDDSWTAIAGPIAAAEGLEETTIEQLITNSSYQSGGSINPTITFMDHATKATMKGFAVGNSRAAKFFAFEYLNGRLMKTSLAIFPHVTEAPKFQRSEGDSGWKLMLKLDDDAPIAELDSLTA